MMARLVLNKFLYNLSLLFNGTVAIVCTLVIYNTFSPYKIPTEPVYWPITAGYGLALLVPFWQHRRRPICLFAVGIIATVWLANTQLFSQVDGTARGYEVLSGGILFLLQSVGLLVPLFMAEGKDKTVILQALIFSAVMAVYWFGMSVFAKPMFEATFIVNTMDYYLWFYFGNLLFLAKLTATWTPVIDTETRSEAGITYQKAA